jgi:membrane-associated protein
MSPLAVLPLALLPSWLSAEGLFDLLGPWALVGFTAIIFLECAIFVGLFFPGDSLLFLTGLLVASGQMKEPLWLVMLVLYVAAVLGNVVGYHFGAAIGPRLLNRPNSKLLRPEYVAKTQEFFERHGTRAIVLARFVPIVRTLITAVAGIAGMDRKRFYVYSAAGAVVWVIGVTWLGSLLGEIEFVRANLEPILLGMVVLSVIPVILEIRKSRS